MAREQSNLPSRRPQRADPIGKRFGMLTVLQEVPRRGRHRKFLCLCDCGDCCITSYNSMRSGGSQSCGCLSRKQTAGANRTHGLSQTQEYSIWAGIKDRCLNARSTAYVNYGGRGITICDRWKDSFIAFYADMGPRPSRRHSINRIDNDGPYDPRNCEWVTTQTQAANTRRTRLITHDGLTLPIVEWERRLGMRGLIRARLAARWTVDEAFGKKPRVRSGLDQVFTMDGESMTVRQWALRLGMWPNTLYARLGAGWTIERAVTEALHGNAGRLISYNGQTMSIRAWSERTGLNTATIRRRISAGWSPEQILTTSAPPRAPSRLLTHDGQSQSLVAWGHTKNIAPATISARLRHGWSVAKALNTPVRLVTT